MCLRLKCSSCSFCSLDLSSLSEMLLLRTMLGIRPVFSANVAVANSREPFSDLHRNPSIANVYSRTVNPFSSHLVLSPAAPCPLPPLSTRCTQGPSTSSCCRRIPVEQARAIRTRPSHSVVYSMRFTHLILPILLPLVHMRHNWNSLFNGCYDIRFIPHPDNSLDRTYSQDSPDTS